MRAFTLLLVGSLAACGSSSPPDAGVPDAGAVDAGPTLTCLADTVDGGNADAGWDGGLVFSCRGKAPARGGQAELVISGTVTRAGFSRTALPDIQVELLRPDGTVVASTSSDDAGRYRLTFDAGCEPVGGEVRATHRSPDAGYFVSWSSPPAPWIRDRERLEMVLFDTSTSALAAALAGVTIVDGGVLALRVADCDGNPVEGAVVTTGGGAGAVRYVRADGLPSSTLAATSSTGDVLIFNLPGTTVEVSAMLDGGLIGKRVIPIHTNAVSGSSLTP